MEADEERLTREGGETRHSDAATTTLAGNFQYNGNACAGAPLATAYFYADPSQPCSQYSTSAYLKVNCTSSPQVIGVSSSATCSPVVASYNTTCVAQPLGQGFVSYVSGCRQVDLSTIVTTRYYTDAACSAATLQEASIFPVDTCNLATYSALGASKLAKFSIASDGNVTASLFNAAPCTGTADATAKLVTNACTPVGVFSISNVNKTVYVKAQPGVPWASSNSTTPTTSAPSGASSLVPPSRLLLATAGVASFVVAALFS